MFLRYCFIFNIMVHFYIIIIFFYLLLHFRHARVANLYVLLVALLPGSVGLSLHLPGSPEPDSGCKSFRQNTILTIRLPFALKNAYPPRRAGNTVRVVSRL